MHLLKMSSNLKPCVPSNKKEASPLEGEEEEEESSSSSSSSVEEIVVNVSAKIEGEDHQHHDHQLKESIIDGNGDEGEDDEGYHTPTSPSNRIPAAVACPPAPRKPSYVPPRFKKRKACCLIEIKDVESMFRESKRSRRKAMEEVASSE